MIAMPFSVVRAVAGVAACVDGSRPTSVTVASGTIRPLGSTTVTCTRASRGACADARAGIRRANKKSSRTNSRDMCWRSPEPQLLSAERKFPGVDLRVQPESVERRFFRRVGTDGAAKAERKLHAIGVAIVRVIQPVFDRRRQRLLPHRGDLL